MPKRFEAERGQAMVEFALVIPVVFAVLFGIIDFGRALYTYDLVTSAARIGSRYAMVHGPSCSGAPACTATSTDVRTYVRSTVSGVDATNLSVTATWPAAAGCAGGSPVDLCPVRVSVSYPFQFVLSFNLTITMTSTSEMVISR